MFFSISIKQQVTSSAVHWPFVERLVGPLVLRLEVVRSYVQIWISNMALILSVKAKLNTRRIDKQMNMRPNQKKVDDFSIEITYAELEYSDHCHQAHLKEYKALDHLPQFLDWQVKLHSPTPTLLQLSTEYFLQIILLFLRRGRSYFSFDNQMNCRNETYIDGNHQTQFLRRSN